VADGVAEHDGAGAAADGSGVQTLDGGRIGANGVFGDIHGGKIVFDGELDGFFRGALQMIHGPIFHQAANRAGAEKGGGFNGNAYTLGDFGDGADVGF